MKVIILVGGFATRLYPLTKDRPKALLPINGTPILDYIITKLERVDEINEVVVVGNSFFKQTFEKWKNSRIFRFSVKIINDDGVDNKSKPGALGGLRYALNKIGPVNEEIFLLAGDNYFDFELKPFVDYYHQKNSNVLIGGEFDDLDYLGKNFGVAELNQDGLVLNMEEKPQKPKSNIGLYAFYLFKPNAQKNLETYFAEGNNPDALGYFIKWLSQKEDVFCHVTREKCFDIGTIEMYNYVCEYDKQKRQKPFTKKD